MLLETVKVVPVDSEDPIVTDVPTVKVVPTVTGFVNLALSATTEPDAMKCVPVVFPVKVPPAFSNLLTST